MKSLPCAISIADHTGWAHVVSVSTSNGVPVVVDRRRVTLIDDGLPGMVYHHTIAAMTDDAADALIADVQKSVARCARKELKRLVADLAPAHKVVTLAIRRPPFDALPASVSAVRQSYALQNGADGVMYQLALCAAARDLGLTVKLCRRGEEVSTAAERLGVSTRAVESFVTTTGRPAGTPWTQEHRRAFTAGIAALLAHSPRRTLTLA